MKAIILNIRIAQSYYLTILQDGMKPKVVEWYRLFKDKIILESCYFLFFPQHTCSRKITVSKAFQWVGRVASCVNRQQGVHVVTQYNKMFINSQRERNTWVRLARIYKTTLYVFLISEGEKGIAVPTVLFPGDDCYGKQNQHYKSNKNNHAAELQGEVKKTKRKEVATV